MENRIFTQSQGVTPKIFINYKEKNNNFPMEKSSRNHHNHMIKLTLPNNKTY